MVVFKLLSEASKGLFGLSKTAIKTAAKTKRELNATRVTEGKYSFLSSDNYPFLHSSDYLKELLFPLIKSKNAKESKQAAEDIVSHIRKHDVSDLEGYKIVLKTIKKYFKEIDITDLL